MVWYGMVPIVGVTIFMRVSVGRHGTSTCTGDTFTVCKKVEATSHYLLVFRSRQKINPPVVSRQTRLFVSTGRKKDKTNS